jgi:AGCS family alanine or glycine:cation symporter
MSQGIAAANHAVHAFVGGVPMVALFLLTGIYFTVSTGVFQIRKFFEILRSPFSFSGKGDSIGAFGALSTALAGTLGIGNIIGVTAAIASGGAGAVFWMWIGAFTAWRPNTRRSCSRCAAKSPRRKARFRRPDVLH